jgi:hypothetical protein
MLLLLINGVLLHDDFLCILVSIFSMAVTPVQWLTKMSVVDC